MQNELQSTEQPSNPIDRSAIFFQESFLSQSECQELITRHQLNSSTTPSAVIDSLGKVLVTQKYRDSREHFERDGATEFQHIIDRLHLRFKQAWLTRSGAEADGKIVGGLTVLGYDRGGHFNWHRDSSKSMRGRFLTAAILLTPTSQFKGGEFLFARLNQKSAQAVIEAGDLLIFPSEAMHKVRPVTEGKRFSMVALWSDLQAQCENPTELRYHAECEEPLSSPTDPDDPDGV